MVEMRVSRRLALVALLLVGPLPLGALVPVAWATTGSDAPVRGGKTVKECNEELARQTAALEAAGESASAFFHACWFQTEKGKPTPIVAKAQGPEPMDGPPASRSSAPGSSTPGSGASGPAATADGARGRGVGRRAARHVARREVRRPGRVTTGGDDGAAGVDDVAVTSTAVTPTAVEPAADRLPGHVNVGVPGVGVVAVPILPGLEPAVEVVVEHPVVPGLVTTSP